MTVLAALALASVAAPADFKLAVDRLPTPGRFALVVAGQGTRETAETAGLRHLLEHLVALGPKRDLDARLEAHGAFLRAETSRTAVELSVTGPAHAFPAAVAALAEAVKQFHATPEDVRREAALIREEAALRAAPQAHAAAAWKAAFGAFGTDPMGDGAALADVEPGALARLHAETFRPSRLVVCAAGDLDPEEAAAMVRAAFSGLAEPQDAQAAGEPPEGQAGARARAAAEGTARAAPIAPIDTRGAMATLAAGFAIQRAVPGSVLLVTASTGPGLATVWSPRGFPELLDQTPDALVAGHIEAGVADLAAWLWPPDPLGAARARARLGAMAGVRAPWSLAGLARGLEPGEVAKAAAAFGSGIAVEVEGR